MDLRDLPPVDQPLERLRVYQAERALEEELLLTRSHDSPDHNGPEHRCDDSDHRRSQGYPQSPEEAGFESYPGNP